MRFRTRDGRRLRVASCLLSLAVTSAAVVGCGASGDESGNSIKIGAIISQSGTAGVYAQPYLNAIELAVKQINDGRGITVGGTRYTIDLQLKDDRTNPGVATSAATGLVNDDHVKFIFGGSTSATAPPIAQILAPSKTIFFTAANSVGPLLTPELVAGPNKTIFLTGPTGDQYADAIEFAMRQAYPNAKTAAIIANDAGNGRASVPDWSQGVEQAGIKVVGAEYYPADAADYSTALTSIKAKQPDVLLVCCTAEAPAIAKRASELNVAPAYLGYNASVGEILKTGIPQPYSIIGYPGLLETLPNGEQVAPRPGEAQYLKDLKSVLGRDATASESIALYYYDYVFMLADAIEKAGSIDDTNAIADALVSMERTGGALGRTWFSPTHRAVTDYDLCTASNGTVSCKSYPNDNKVA